MINISEEIIEKIRNHRSKVNDFQNGKIEKKDFKKYCSSFGIYEERGFKTYMLRAAIIGGMISIPQFKTISTLANKYGKKWIHFTTRQDIQFHGLNLNETVDLAEHLIAINIMSKGSGGNCVRNIACSSLSGVSEDDIFDVSAFAIESSNYLLKDSSSFDLPRKFKISFSNSLFDTANATITDLGFIAKIQNGIKGFEVYAAGGLGKNPAIALKLEDFIPANDFLYYVDAVIELFKNEGDSENRNKARLRYVLFRLGEENFRNLYKFYLDRAKEKHNFNFLPEKLNIEKINLGDIKKFSIPNNPLLFKQKCGQLYSVYVHSENGNILLNDLNKILDFIEKLEYKVSIRLTNTQGFFIRDLTLSDAEKLLNIISDFTSTFNLDNSISCIGASICTIGICKSRELLTAIKEKFKNSDSNIKSALP